MRRKNIDSYLTKTMTLLLIYLSALNLTFGQTFQIYNGDTINVVDANNMKQGHWIYFGNMKQLPGFAPEAKVEEGDFNSNRKTGLWIKYYPDGKLQSEITFTNNRPNGPYKTYYQNGQVEEQGVWQNNRNTEHFVRYYENGEKQQDFNFNESGKRAGRQEYYYENGQLMIEGDWNEGKEDGLIKEYYADGSVKAEKFYNGGALDAAKTKKYEPKNEIKEVVADANAKQSEKVDVNDVQSLEGDKKIIQPAIRNSTSADIVSAGEHTLYNKNRQISQKGMFKDGRLMDGKWYRYDENGILTSIEIYKGGKYVGEGVIEE